MQSTSHVSQPERDSGFASASSPDPIFCGFRALECGRLSPDAVSQVSGDRSHTPLLDRRSAENPGPPPGFLFDGRLSVGDGDAGADRQSGEPKDRVAAGVPVREFVLVQLFWQVSLSHADKRPGLTDYCVPERCKSGKRP